MPLIMIVEDDPSINALMALTLRVEDYEVIQARDGEQALRLLETQQPDLILLDVMMPRISGYEVARTLQDNPATAHIPIIFVTAKAAMEDRVRGLDLAVDYVCKPFAAPELLARVRVALRMQQLQEELRISNEQLRHLATTDVLTSLSNRRHFDSAFADEVNRAQRYSHSIALVLFDLDHFKKINDRHGHEQGDAALRAFGEVLRNSSRRIDTVARMGGEEFTAVLPETDEEGARAFAEKVRLATKALSVPTLESFDPAGKSAASTRDAEDALRMTVSAGVAVLAPRDPKTTASPRAETALLQCADRMLYAAKGAGRDCIKSRTLMPDDLASTSANRLPARLHDGS